MARAQEIEQKVDRLSLSITIPVDRSGPFSFHPAGGIMLANEVTLRGPSGVLEQVVYTNDLRNDTYSFGQIVIPLSMARVEVAKMIAQGYIPNVRMGLPKLPASILLDPKLATSFEEYIDECLHSPMGGAGGF